MPNHCRIGEQKQRFGNERTEGRNRESQDLTIDGAAAK
jgi:hypothetical protein